MEQQEQEEQEVTLVLVLVLVLVLQCGSWQGWGGADSEFVLITSYYKHLFLLQSNDQHKRRSRR